MNPFDIIAAAQADGLQIGLADGQIEVRGPAEARARWRDQLLLNKPALIEYMTAIPQDVRNRLVRLKTIGAVEDFDVWLIGKCWATNPADWLRLLDDCERTHRELLR